MNINMTSEQYRQITNFSKSSKIEQAGEMEVAISGNDLVFLRLVPSQEAEVHKATRNCIEYNSQEFIWNTLYNIAYAKDGIYVRFHTHPTSGGAADLSKKDLEMLKYYEELANQLVNNGHQRTTIIDAIVTDTEVAFYKYDKNTDTVKRLPLLVDGIDRVPMSAKSKWQILKDGILEGRNKVRK